MASTTNQTILTMDKLSIVTIPAPKGPIPIEMMAVAIARPDTLDPAPSYPVLDIDGFTLWALSYKDNRYSLGMVMYNPEWNMIAQVEKPGARYVYKITKDGTGTSGSVIFSGQFDKTVTISLDEIWQMMVK